LEEIERFTLAYKRQLDKNKIKSRWSALEFTLVFPLALLQDLLPLNISGAVKEFFEWRRRERQMLDVESSVKSDELAYLVEVEQFLST
jgi:hypothetical protein